ncbi:MAG: HPr(Ser) kinase/phosphatase [bacterium]
MSRKPILTVEQLYKEFGKDDVLIPLNPSANLEKEITKIGVNRPSLAFAGFFDTFAEGRIQVIGKTECDFLETKDVEYRKKIFKKIVNYDIPCFIIARSLPCPVELLTEAEEKRIMIFSTMAPTGILIANLCYYLYDTLTEQVLIYGVLIDIYGVGVLILGKSGIGKSECALELISRGHCLIADDQVITKRLIGGEIVGKSDEKLRDYMEIQGIGIMNVVRIFGAGATKESKRIELVIMLEEFDKNKDYDRTGLHDELYDILGVKLPYITIPVIFGKNIATLIEVAVKNHILKQKGYHSAREFNSTLIERMLEEEKRDRDI